MQNYGQEEPELSEEEQAIADVLGEKPRARELEAMRLALQQRRDAIRRDRDQATDKAVQTRLQAKIQELNKQITALHQEEQITQFVENSVRVTLHKKASDTFDDQNEE